MPYNYGARLRKLALSNPDFSSFSPVFLQQPNADPENDNAHRSFSAKNQILERARQFLLGYEYDYMREVFVQPQDIKPTLSTIISQTATPPDPFSAYLLRGLREKFAGGVCNQTDR